MRKDWTTPVGNVTRSKVTFTSPTARVAVKLGNSKRLVLPASLRGWRVTLTVGNTKVTLGTVSKQRRTPVLTPPGPGTYTLTLTGPRGATRTIKLTAK